MLQHEATEESMQSLLDYFMKNQDQLDSAEFVATFQTIFQPEADFLDPLVKETVTKNACDFLEGMLADEIFQQESKTLLNQLKFK